jgi:hypothetical protein
MPNRGERVDRKKRNVWGAARASGPLVLIGILAASLAPIAPPGSMADALSLKPAVGVLDFAAPPTVNSAGTVIPQQFAGDDLSSQLASAAENRFVMLARNDVRQAQAALNWSSVDADRRERLAALAERVHADKLVVGRITTYNLESEGGGGGRTRGFTGTTTISVRVFDVHSRQWTWQTTASGNGRASTAGQAVRNLMRSAVTRTVSGVATALSNAR